MNRIRHLKDRHKGERCILVCNGPSLNKMNLSFLRRHYSIGMNKIYLGFRKFNFYPKYYVSVNKKVLHQAASAIQQLNCVKFISRHHAPDRLTDNALTYLIDTQTPKHRFCSDLEDGMHEGWTVTYAALQVAYFLGFKQVIIIGMDHHFTYQGQPNEATIMQGGDPNHFSDAYFGHGQTWDNPDIAHSEESYHIAKQIFEQDGREIIDATLDGHCNIFKKMDYRELLSS